MRKVELNMNKQYKYEVIKDCCDRNLAKSFVKLNEICDDESYQMIFPKCGDTIIEKRKNFHKELYLTSKFFLLLPYDALKLLL